MCNTNEGNLLSVEYLVSHTLHIDLFYLLENDFPSSWVSERHELCDSGDRGPDVVDVLPHHLHHGEHVYHGHRESLPQ